MESKAKVFEFSNKLFPVGSYAWHRRYHYCRIVEVTGMKRVVKTPRNSLEGIVYRQYQVPVKELEAVDNFVIDALGLNFPLDDHKE